MAQMVSPYPTLPKPFGSSIGALSAFDTDLNRALTFYLGAMARRVNGALMADGSEPAASLTVTGTAIFNGPVSFVSVDPGAAEAPVVTLYRNSASPANGDVTGVLTFSANASNGALTRYNQIYQTLLDVTVGSEDGRLTVQGLVNGAGTDLARFDGTSVELPLGRLQFPAAANPSSNANTLDDYEEGTWTPVVQFGGLSTGITYSSQSGVYTKCGGFLLTWHDVELTNKGTATGAAYIAGLPFGTVSEEGLASTSFYTGMAGLTSAPFGYTSGTVIVLHDFTATSVVGLDNTNFTNTSRHLGGVSQRVA